MNSNDNAIKLTKKEYYRNYQIQNRNKIREINRSYYQNKISDANLIFEKAAKSFLIRP